MARAHGAEVPFLRPEELAADSTPDLPVLLHALDLLGADGYHPSAVAWLRPTAPLRDTTDVTSALGVLAADPLADAVRSVCAVEHPPSWQRRIEAGLLVPYENGPEPERRQLQEPVYRLNGAVDITRPDGVRDHGIFGGRVRPYVMPAERSVDVDTELDLAVVEAFLARRMQG